ncbi:MAG TPA: type II toxin-antitoxin system PrlF family antitoxin [Acidocella sp.]|uniref:type II toxin-antitoxin system PrlF family antitoxin n=1 Tax=Acidocella sp. TaxID=50710 RepID=UPI002D1D5A9D|nr:type II toxin-antitoxin system PrlF family antitoxin [Acidocella sp.]HVE21275.1 type II toxin-antitoxin system PrlF family antitoxin [Acidocella sp.]
MQVVEEVCTITAKGQTTVPKTVRKALGVGYGGRIAFRVEGNTVTIHAMLDDAEQDPALSPFLSLLAADLAARPEDAVRPLTPALASRMGALAKEIGDVDLDAPIEGDVSL